MEVPPSRFYSQFTTTWQPDYRVYTYVNHSSSSFSAQQIRETDDFSNLQTVNLDQSYHESSQDLWLEWELVGKFIGSCVFTTFIMVD